MYFNIMANTTAGSATLIDYLDKEENSVKRFTDYLEKENVMDSPDYFFNESSREIQKDEVCKGIDSNNYKLSLNEHRFFSITVNPSKKEIEHLKNLASSQVADLIRIQEEPGLKAESEKTITDTLIKEMMKEYAISFMDEYALNFNREGINSSKDLVWYARVEKDRYWKGNSKEVQHNKKLQREISKALNMGDESRASELRKELILESDVRKGGANVPITEWMPKSGTNYHIHIVVSRRDRYKKYRLSPLSKARKNSEHKVNGRTCMVGFDRNKFSNAIEAKFDNMTAYGRGFSERYESRKLAKEDPEKYREKLIEHYKQNRDISSNYRSYKDKSQGYKNAGRIRDKAIQSYFRISTCNKIEGSHFVRGVTSSLQSKNMSRQLAVKLFSQYAALAGMSSLAPVIAPYKMMYSLGSKMLTLDTGRKDSRMER